MLVPSNLFGWHLVPIKWQLVALMADFLCIMCLAQVKAEHLSFPVILVLYMTYNLLPAVI